MGKPVLPEELHARIEDRARATMCKDLALTALYLRDGDDFVSDAVCQLDVVRIERAMQADILKCIGDALEHVNVRGALLAANDLVESLALALAIAKHLVAVLKADVDQAERDARGEGGTR